MPESFIPKLQIMLESQNHCCSSLIELLATTHQASPSVSWRVTKTSFWLQVLVTMHSMYITQQSSTLSICQDLSSKRLFGLKHPKTVIFILPLTTTVLFNGRRWIKSWSSKDTPNQLLSSFYPPISSFPLLKMVNSSFSISELRLSLKERSSIVTLISWSIQQHI